MNEKIEFCPCCKGEAEKVIFNYYIDDNKNGGEIQIFHPAIKYKNCGLELEGTDEDCKLDNPYENVIKKWNRREK